MIQRLARALACLLTLTALVVSPALLHAQEGASEAKKEEAPPPDVVLTKAGSKLVGTVTTMGEGALTIKTPSTGDVKVQWGEIESLTTNSALPFVFADGSRIVGTVTTNDQGQLVISSPNLAAPVPFALDAVESINPPKVKTTTYKLVANAGVTINDGNTDNRAGSVFSEFLMRNKRTRLLLRAAYNYAEDEDDITARNGRGSMKFDYFPTDRFFFYVSTLFENDKFQDLNLRTALSAGPGYQFIEKGDYADSPFEGLELFGEAGIAYFDEDRRRGEDQNYVSARWSVKLDWDIVPGEVSFFHFHEGFPSLENGKDLYITTEQGVRFKLMENLIAAIHVNWRWDNTPSDGFGRSDTTYMFTLGFTYDA